MDGTLTTIRITSLMYAKQNSEYIYFSAELLGNKTLTYFDEFAAK